MQKKQQFAFSAINFYLLAVSIVTVLIGFVLMSGKGSPNTHFDPAIFNNTRTVVVSYHLLCRLSFHDSRHPLSSKGEERGGKSSTSSDHKRHTSGSCGDLETDAPLQTTSCVTTSAEA